MGKKTSPSPPPPPAGPHRPPSIRLVWVVLVLVLAAALYAYRARTHSDDGNDGDDNDGDDFRRGMEVLNWDHRVAYYPRFLNATEIDWVLARGGALLEAKHGPNWRTFPRLVVMFESAEDKRHPIVRRIEEKVALATLVPPHEEELDLMLSFTTTRPFDRAGNAMTNVHHDTNGAINRVMTAVIYMSDVAHGGHTVFPAIGDPTIGEHPVNRDLARTFAKAYETQQRHVLYPDHWNNTAIQLTNAMCREELPALRVRPRRGSAVVFASRYADGRVDPFTWHAACAVKDSLKITLQKFKEFDRHTGEWVLDNWTQEDGSPNQPRWVQRP